MPLRVRCDAVTLLFRCVLLAPGSSVPLPQAVSRHANADKPHAISACRISAANPHAQQTDAE